MSNYEQSNVGMGMVPHKKNCRCEECTIERLDRLAAKLEGDLEVMRLQRDAKLVSETPRNNALKARVEELEAELRKSLLREADLRQALGEKE